MAPSSPPRVVVQKYGGSSVADVSKLRAVARRVAATREAGSSVVVVVSAMGNTTNELLALARSVSANPGRRELDLLVSVGERVSMTLLAMALHDLGVPAASFTGSQSGIVTDENHLSAAVIEVRPDRVRAALEEGKVAIVAGFQGVSRTREVTTLGRGGGDTTAVVLAAALGAEHCEICSDIDGVWTADPRAVSDARRLPELALDAAAALARGGSKVLLADAVEQARRLGVTLVASATDRPPASGTALPPGPTPAAVVGIAADPELELLELPVEALAAIPLGGAVRSVHARAEHADVLVDLRNLHDRAALALPAGARSLGPVATVTAVGRCLVTEPVSTARALAALGGIPLRGWWACGDAWTAVMDRKDAKAAQSALHRALLGE